MKTIILFLTAVALCVLPFQSQAQITVIKSDTIIHFNQKRILVQDSVDQIKVKVYKNDTMNYKPIYEGIFTDEKSVEKWTVAEDLGFHIPFIKKRNKRYYNHYYMNGHFSEFSFGMLYIHNHFTNFNDAGGMTLNFSNEINLNPFSYTMPIYKDNIGITTGLGMTWRNYHFDSNQHLVVQNGITTVQVPENIKYTYSRLRTYELTAPIFLEIQPRKNSNFYLTGGVLFGVNAFSSFKVKYKDANGNKISTVEGKNYNVNPFSFSYVFKCGYDDFGMYVKYTPTKLFKNDKGPDVQTASVGLTLNF